jgi:hypothetical protein
LAAARRGRARLRAFSRCSSSRSSALITVLEHDHPGSLIHVDVTKLANIPDGGGADEDERPTDRADSQHTDHGWAQSNAIWNPTGE